MAWEENSRICLHMQLIAILSRIGVIMENTQTDSLQFCLNDALSLLQCNHVKAEKHLVRKTVQDCWKLQPAPNGLTYTTYEYNYNNGCQYSPIKRVGRFYTITRDKLNGK